MSSVAGLAALALAGFAIGHAIGVNQRIPGDSAMIVLGLLVIGLILLARP